MYISIKRICEIKAPFKVCIENANDWTHFIHLHRDSHKEFRLLYKAGEREIFLYKAKHLKFLPFYTTYIVFRRDAPEISGFQQIYLNIKNGDIQYLHAENLDNKDTTLVIGNYVFSVPSYWRLAPQLLFWIFKKRMKKVLDQDSELLRDRLTVGIFDNPTCAPAIPSNYDFFFDLMKKDFPKAEVHFEDYAYSDPLKKANG